MTLRPYTELPVLRDFYLEDSFVLDITARPGTLDMIVDFVLTPEHREYSAPASGVQQSYRRGTILFRGVNELRWKETGWQSAQDATGERDHGGFDSYQFDGGRHVIEGDWGILDVHCTDIVVDLDEV